MKKYNVDIMPLAHKELKESYEWGCKRWGVTKAKQWMREAQKAILSLSQLPERHPIAPEADEFKIEIRQIVFQRYRILFLVGDDTVHVLHIRGSYHQEEKEQDKEKE